MSARIDFGPPACHARATDARAGSDGIGTQVHYIPVHRQPYYLERYGALSLPGADAYYAGALSLPLFAAMTEDDAERVAGALMYHLKI